MVKARGKELLSACSQDGKEYMVLKEKVKIELLNTKLDDFGGLKFVIFSFINWYRFNCNYG